MDDLRSILNGVCRFVVTLQKYPNLADLDRLSLTKSAMSAPDRNVSPSF